jgi:hypothetical protein
MAARQKPAAPAPESFLPLTPAVFHILVALGDGEAHGYAIMQTVSEKSMRAVRMGAGTLYGAISRLLEEGLVEESEERPGRRTTALLSPDRLRSTGPCG